MATLEIMGRRVEVDDSFRDLTAEQRQATVNEIAAQMQAQTAPASAPAPHVPPQAQPHVDARPEPTLDPRLQGLARTAADIAGTPVDLATLGVNAGLGLAEVGANLFLSDDDEINLPQITNPVGGSDWLADLVSALFEDTTGVATADPEDMPTADRYGYNSVRFGGQAALGGAGLARAAATLFGSLAGARAGATLPRRGDRLLAPYRPGAAGRTIAADTAAGAGAGAALTGAEEYAPDSTIAQIAAMLGGGMAGGALGNVATSAATRPGAAVSALTGGGFRTDPSIPVVPGTLQGTSRRVAEAAARVMQSQATDPAAAAARIGERSSLSALYGDPMPTSGLASGDDGLVGFERGLRLQANPDAPTLRKHFVESDSAVKRRAASVMEDLRDPAADQAAGLDFARNLPDQLAQARDDAALPILRRVEQSTAEVDVDPVLQAIEGTLAETKRPAVRSALEQARSMLNLPGTDDIDTSVAGLYETRKAISDIIDGRTDNPTGRYAKRE